MGRFRRQILFICFGDVSCYYFVVIHLHGCQVNCYCTLLLMQVC